MDVKENKIETKQKIEVKEIKIEPKKLKIQIDKKDQIARENLIIKMFSFLNRYIKSLDELFNIEDISREQLLNETVKKAIIGVIPELKKYYSSCYCKSLQQDGHKKPNFTINVYRQILNRNGYMFKSFNKHHKYDPKTGVKIVKRWYKVVPKTVK